MVWIHAIDTEQNRRAHIALFGDASTFHGTAFSVLDGTPLLFGRDGYMVEPTPAVRRLD